MYMATGHRKTLATSESAERMDGALAEVDPASPVDTFAEWRALVAAETSRL